MAKRRDVTKKASVSKVLSPDYAYGSYNHETGIAEVVDSKWVGKGSEQEYVVTHISCALPFWLVEAINNHANAKVNEALSKVRQALGCDS